MQVTTQMGPFSIVPEWVLDRGLSSTALKLYIVLARFADWETGIAFPARDTLAERMDCSEKTVDRAVKELVDAECIEKQFRGRYASARYRVLQVDPRGTKLSAPETELSDEGTNLSSRPDKNVHITITTKREPKEPEPLNDMFDQFWKIYPIKKDKPKARRAFEKALKRASLQTILDGATRYRDDPNREDKYTKYPEGWLNNDAWENGPLPAPKPHRANWEDAADLARKYREQETAAIEYENKATAEALEADAITWLKGVDDD